MTQYRVSPNVRWVVDRYTVTVTDGRGTMRTLNYPEAAVWDLFTRGTQYDKVVAMVGHVASLDAAASEQVVRDSIDDWTHSGFLERS